MGVSVTDFKPLNDYVVVLIPKIGPKTKAGIIKDQKTIQEEFEKTPQLFKVMAIGSKVENINVGEYVLCTRINRVPVESNDEEFETAVVRVFDIVGTSHEV